MLTHDMEEKLNGRVDIKDLDAETVHNMIIYIYSGKVTELKSSSFSRRDQWGPDSGLYYTQFECL